MGVSRKQSTPNFPKNKDFLPPDTHTYVIRKKKAKGKITRNVCVSGGKKCSFFGNFGVPCFLETAVLRFTLLSYYRRFQVGLFIPNVLALLKNLLA